MPAPRLLVISRIAFDQDMEKIGITTTIASEVLIAAGYMPLDLNNCFVGSSNPTALIKRAEKAGFPVNCCAWIKGIYGAVLEYDVKRVICVTSGDCSNTEMLLEVLELQGIQAFPFRYPPKPNHVEMLASLQELSSLLGTSLSAAEKVRQNLLELRQSLQELDRLTYQTDQVSSWENHRWLVSSSDFSGDPFRFKQNLLAFLAQARLQKAQPYRKRLALIGVPPIYAQELFACLTELGAQVVFNEIPRQFAMVDHAENLSDQYTNYTYPYDTHQRLVDIQRQIDLRQVDGIIHYVQAFCHRGISDIVYRHKLRKPILTIEGNTETTVNQHLITRIEAFLDILR